MLWFFLYTADDAKCPVCLNVQVDPCTLSCGHTVCQLCLARMWKSNNKICPVCKETWKVFPAISYDFRWEELNCYAITKTIISSNLLYRSKIESAHGREIEQLRKEYSQEDKELIEKYLEGKRVFNLKFAEHLSEIDQLPRKLDIYSLSHYNKS